MVEWFTPEMLVIVLIVLTALTVLNSLILLLTIASLSRAKKRLLAVVGKCVKLEAEQTFVQQARQSTSNNVAHLCDVDNKIQFIEHRMDAFDSRIAETQNQLVGFESKLREYDNLLGQAGQMMGKETAGFNQAVQRIRMLEEEFQGLRAFRHTFDETRSRAGRDVSQKHSKHRTESFQGGNCKSIRTE
ncbi:MAG: hypothetical protein P8Z79_17830 [Sedimentisphaerales bacterium]